MDGNFISLLGRSIISYIFTVLGVFLFLEGIEIFTHYNFNLSFAAILLLALGFSIITSNIKITSKNPSLALIMLLFLFLFVINFFGIWFMISAINMIFSYGIITFRVVFLFTFAITFIKFSFIKTY
ncbi:MAG: hypothetical protein QXV17_04915 [Candidatus Micrarchaeaceae archaeon]